MRLPDLFVPNKTFGKKSGDVDEVLDRKLRENFLTIQNFINHAAAPAIPSGALIETSTPQTIVANVVTTLAFTGATTSWASGKTVVDVGNSQFVVPYEGLYELNMNVLWDNSGQGAANQNYAQAQLFINGANRAGTQPLYLDSNLLLTGGYQNWSILESLLTGDTLQIEVSHNCTGTIKAKIYRFSFYLVGSTPTAVQ